MPVVVSNNFSQDTYGMRSERLIAIQSNFASIQPILSAPAEVATWSDDCYDVYANLLALSELETNESEGLTVVVAEKEAALDEMYQYVKGMGLTIYKDMPKLIQDYGFEFQYPIRRTEKLKFADKVIQCYDRNVIDLVTPLIPAIMITRLRNARDEFYTALGNQDKERSDARHAVAVLSDQFVRDTQKLNELKLWSFAMLGKDEPRMGLIGMVNPGTGGGGSSNLAAPTNLTVDVSTMIFSWDAVENATSYVLETSVAGMDWETIYSGTDNFVNYIPPSPGLRQYKAKARSNSGFGPSSGVLMYNYHGVGTPQNLTFNSSTHLCSWDAVSGATSYQAEILKDAPDEEWVNIYTGAANQTVHVNGDGLYLLRVRSGIGSNYGEWSDGIFIGYMTDAPITLVPSVNYGANTQVTLTGSLLNGIPQYRLFLGYGPLGSSTIPVMTESIIVTATPILVPTTHANERYFMGLKCYDGLDYSLMNTIVSIDVNELTS